MKRNLTKLLLLLVVLVMSICSMQAQSWTSGAPLPDEEGEYYLYNIGGDRFINRGSTWTTHAIADGQGFVTTLTKKSDGVYSIYTGIPNGKYLSGEWVDSNETPFTFTSVEVAGYTNVFTIASDNKYLSFVNGSGSYGSEVLFKDAIQDGNLSYWLLIPKATRQDFSAATKDNPLDVTWLIKNPDFDYQVSNNNDNKPAAGWEQSTLKDWTHNGYWRQNSEQAFAKGNFAEKWSGNGYSDTHKIHQSPTLPKGVYKLSCGGTARYNKFFLYAANRSTQITNAGTYDVYFEMESEGACELGARIEPGGTGDWAALDNVRLSYYGTATTLAAVLGIDDAVLEAKYAEVDQTKLMNADTKTALVNAYNTAKASLTVDNYEALVAAVEAAKASISKYDEIGNRIWIANTFMYNEVANFDASSVSTKYNGGQYANDYNPDEIYREYAQLYNAQTVAAPNTDYTLGIVNPTFETGNTFGWTHGSSADTGVKANSNATYSMTNCDRDHLFNTWWKGVPLTQTIENIPNGIYRLTVTVASGDDGKDAYIYATANGSREVVKCPQGTKGTGRDVSVTTVVSGGTITIGTIGGNEDGSYNEEGHWWYKADNFRLTYLQSIDDYIAPLKAKLTADAQDGFAEAANTALSLEDIDAAYKAAVRKQTTAGANYTDIIVNPSFETGDTQGWTHGNSQDTGARNNPMSGKDGDYVFNTWWWGVPIKQTIEGLPNGLYKLSAIVASSDNDNPGRVYLIANNDHAGIDCAKQTQNTGYEGSVTTAVTNGKLTIGAVGANTNGLSFIEAESNVWWYKVDNFRLEYAGALNEVASINELAASTGAVNFNMDALQVLNAGEDSIVVQDVTGDAPIGIVIKGTKDVEGAATAEYGKTISGHFYGTYDAATHYFTLENNTGNTITTATGEATVNGMELVDAANTTNAYLLTTIEMATVVEEGEGVFYAKKNNDKIQLDKRLNPSLMFYDGEGVISITGITFVNDEGTTNVLAPMSQKDIRSNKAEADAGSSYAQGEDVNTVNGVIMNFGGNDPEGAKYEFAATDPVNKLGTMTEGINTFPVDDEDKAYDPEQKNLPTKGTYYVFTPTKDGQLDVTVDLEQGKKLFVTEDGEALKDFNGITTVNNNLISFPVEAMKTYYVFANETNLAYYGFSFTLADAYAKNVVKDIATFKRLPEDNADGDTLLLKDAVVTYIKGDNVYVEDASSAIVFFQTGIQFYVGQKLNGYIVGQNHTADNMPQLRKTDKTSYKTFKVTETATPEAKEVAIADAPKEQSLARFAKLTDVRTGKDAKGFRILTNKEKTASIRIEDRFNVFYELPEVVGSIQGIIGIDKEGTFFFWPTSKDVPEGVGLTEAEEKLLAEAKKLAEDREAVAVGLLDDEIEKAEAGYGKGLQAAVDKFKENNANNAKETYAKDKAAMQTLIDEAEELLADETLQSNREELTAALEAGKTAQASIRLNVPQFEEEIFKLRQAIADFKEANHIGGNYLATGKYVLKNVASGLYWGAGNNWGTRASLLDYSEYQTLIMKPDGTYTMESQVSNGGTNYFFGGDYMDGQPMSLTITPIEIETEGEATEEPLTAAMFKHYASIDAAEGTATGCAFALNEKTGLPYGDGNVFWLNYADLTNYDKLTVTVSAGTPRFCLNRTEDNAQDNDDPATTKFIDIPGHSWGTEAYQTKIDDNTYVLDLKKMREERGIVHLHSIKGAWWQDVTVTSMTLTKAAEAQKKVLYTVADGDKYFGNSTEEGSLKGTYILGKELSADDENALWEIIPATTDALAAATEDKPMDATFLILNPNFGRNNRNGNAWNMVANNQNMRGGFNDNANQPPVNHNQCAESWCSAFTLSQEIEVPNGVYAVTAQAALTDYANLYDGANYPVVYANEVTAPFNNMIGNDRGSNMKVLGVAFANDKYTVGPLYVEVTDGKLTVGVKGTRTDTWCIWDNFQLQYYGADADIENLKNRAEFEELQQLRQKATDLMAEVEVAAVKTGLTNALSETANVSGKEAIEAGIATLTAAIDPAEASKTAKNVLPKMKELVDATNVYTEEAYNQYYGTWLAKYEAGTLTKAEANALQDPSVVTGWHAQVTVDDFLMSTWDENVMNWDSYHVNTWSVEGDNDGSNFRVPFIEYWTGDGDSLGEKTLTATMNGLEAGSYDVTAWVRVRMKNGGSAPAYGISLQANDGTAVDVAAGDQIGESQFYLKEFTAQGTVGADGVLNIKFNVAGDNNISWLSFKNVKFKKAGGEPVGPVEPIDPDLIEIAQDQGIGLDGNPRATLEEGENYNTYTATEDLTVAFKMLNIDVKDCDYVVVKFAEPVPAGWNIAFWKGLENVAIPAGSTEYKYEFAKDANCAIENDILPQICVLTLWGAQKPLTAKVTGVYKHKVAPVEIAHTWDFTKWSDATVANLKAEAAKVEVEDMGDGKTNIIAENGAIWSDHEKAAQTDASKYNTTYAASKDNCFWAIEDASELTANGVAIAELKGLIFDASYAKGRSLAIAVNYPSTTLGTYEGPSYLWLGGKNKTCFTIPAVKGGTIIKMGVESHKSSEARGVKLFVGDTELTDPENNAVAAPKAYTEQTWQVPAGEAVNVVVKNTNGCHIYFIDAEQDQEVLTSISNAKNNFAPDGAIYNLRGQKVEGTLKPGLYIKNGRKVVVK